MRFDVSSLASAMKRNRFQKEVDALGLKVTYKTVNLPEDEWHTCSRCSGSGSYLMEGDLHRSTGWVPCDCHGGLIKTKTLKILPRIRVKAISEKI